MEAAAASSYCRPLCFPPHFSSSIKCVIRLKKILPERCSTNCLCDGSFAFASRRRILGSGNGISSSSSMSKKHERKATNPAQEEEIIALFRRIRIAISETESSGSTDDATSPKERLTDDSVSAKAKSKEQRKQGKTIGVLEKQLSQNSLQGEVEEFKRSRPPTNFVRRSPIPSPSPPRGMDNEPEDGKSAALEDNQLENQKIEQMKLAQLKELAKSRGVKGYSKLKKQALVDLLKYGNSLS